MGTLNLFKLDGAKQSLLYQEFNKIYSFIDSQSISKKILKSNIVFTFELYISNPKSKKLVNWNWVSHVFNHGDIFTPVNPKAVLIVKHGNADYAVTFGYSYFLVDKYCDGDFPFDFARKIKYKNIKTTTLISPNSLKNKTVNTYINYNEVEFDSGESYAKLKVNADLPDSFSIFKSPLEIGRSIKFSVENDSLQSIIDIILYVEDTIVNKKDIYAIPVFSKVKDIELIALLDDKIAEDVHKNPSQINVSELDIIGATEIFNHNDGEFTIKYDMYEKNISILNKSEIELFCNENGLNFSDIVLDISVISLKDGVSIRTDKIKNLIDYTNDNEKCILSKGQWYKYNDDYIQYLKNSIQEIDVIYEPKFNFTKQQYLDFINTKFNLEKDETKYSGKNEKEIRNKIMQKYYVERSFNLIRESNDGYKNLDRNEDRVGTVKIEIMDLYKDKTMFAVKIGNTSAKLCYAIDQSLTSLKMYKHKTLTAMPEINKVAIWLVLERQHILTTLSDGKPNLDELNMLMLKNRIDQWKKEVRLLGFTPCIYINYKRF
jgi:uncharacterized protein (TIGR04141 family)